MEVKAKTTTEQILTVMQVLAWVAFIGFLIQAGAILFSYSASFVDPDGARNLYKGLDLYALKQFSFWHYTASVSFLIALSCMKAYISYLVIKTLAEVNMVNPFTIAVSSKLETVSHLLLGTWVIAMLSNAHTGWLLKKTGALQGDWVAGDFIFVAGLVFIIAQVFKRGVEIQSENDLTV